MSGVKVINIYVILCNLAITYGLKDLQDQFYMHRNKCFHIANRDDNDATFDAALNDLDILAHINYTGFPLLNLILVKLRN